MKSLFFISLPMLLLCSCNTNASKGSSETNDSIVSDSVEKEQKISLLFVGDLMQHGVQFKAALSAGGGKTYDYEECFRYVKDEISSVDVAVGNFETTTAGGTPTTYPCFNAPDAYMVACKDAGFDILLTANNHSCDKASKGITRTIQMCDSLGLPHIGTYVDQSERDREYPYILEKNGFRIGLLCYTYATNGIPVPKPHIVNLIDRDQIAKDIQKLKSQKVDCIIATMHWGEEHALLPNQEQKSLANWLFEQGVDHIIGGHPHVVEPIEIREDSLSGDKHLLAYSLGNYISNMSKPNNDGGMMVKMELTKKSGSNKASLTDAGYCLTWVSRPAVSGHKNYRIYPVSVPESELNSHEKSLFNKTLTTERNLFEKHNKNIQEYQVTWTR